MIMQPLHKLALHGLRQRDSMTVSDSDDNLLDFAVVFWIFEVLVMSLLLPRNPCIAKQCLCKFIMQYQSSSMFTSEMRCVLGDLAFSNAGFSCA